MSRPQPPNIDAELIELFGDDAGALAIADALQATAQENVRQGRVRLLMVAAAVIAVAVVAATVSVTRSHAGVIERALAVWPADRVVYVVVAGDDSSTQVVDPATGAAQPVRHMVSEWYDPRTHTRRVVDRENGIAISDTRVRVSPQQLKATPGGFTNDTLAAFPYLYRENLAQTSNRQVSETELNGEPVYWVRFRRPNGLAGVAIDEATYQPRRIVFRTGKRSRTFDVIKAMTLGSDARVPAVAPVPRLRHLPSQTLRISASANALERSVGVRAVRETKEFVIVSAHLVHFAAGDGFDLRLRRTNGSTAALIDVEEAGAPEPQFGWSPARVAATGGGGILVERDGAFTAAYGRAHGRFFRVWTGAGARSAIAFARQLMSG